MYLFIALSVALCGAVVHFLVAQRVENETSPGAEADPATKPASPPAPGTSVAAAGATGPRATAAPLDFLERLPREVGRDIVYLR